MNETMQFKEMMMFLTSFSDFSNILNIDMKLKFLFYKSGSAGSEFEYGIKEVPRPCC